MNEELISVIIPVYNVENYIKKCINSVLIQTYRNLEIILVDDGSKDKSGTMCDDFEKKDSRIKVIHKTNGGLSDARNFGIEKASGKYIMFIDSDDFIDKKMIEILFNNIKKTESDISICGVRIIKEGKKYINKKEYTNDVKILTQNEVYENLYNDKALETVVAWNKLYKRKIFDVIRYPKGKIHEDAFIIHYLINNAKKIVYTSDKLYYYIRRKDSITGKKFNIKRLDELEALEDRVEFFKKFGMNELYDKTIYRYCASNRYSYIKIKDKNIKKQLNEKFNTMVKIIENSKYLTKKEKVKIRILKNILIIYKIKIFMKG